ncbi:MAG: metal dependent phosphohydrolase, partial [Candidatus Magnetoglobus multicellularis str. Araruama]
MMLQEKLQKELSPKRYQHSLRVAREAVLLAQITGFDTQKAQIGGLLHDCAKHLEDNQLIAIAQQMGYTISKQEQEIPHLLHAPVGAWFARIHYGIVDPEILQAISRHALGGPEPSLLDQIVYTADFMEPNRVHTPSFSKKFQSVLQNNFHQAVIIVIKEKLRRLKATGRQPHPYTQKFLWCIENLD